MKKFFLAGVLVLLQGASTRVLAEELTGNANVDSATKIQAMNDSVNKDWNLNDKEGTSLLILFDTGSTRIDRKYAGVLEAFGSGENTHRCLT